MQDAINYAAILRAYHDHAAIQAFVNVALIHAKADIESDSYRELTNQMILALPQDLTDQQEFILTECVTDEYVNFYDFMRAMESRQFA